MLKRVTVVLLASAAIAASASIASAADIGVRRHAAPAPVVVAPVLTWAGFYAGANIGYGWSSGSDPSFTSDLTGVIGGGQLGYNWQTGPLVIGIEGDFQGSGQHRSDTGTIGATVFTVDRRIPWFGTLRGRIGYSPGPLMVYFTGGGAWLNYQLSSTSGGTTVSDNSTTTAWTIGGGAEWMFAPKWSAKLEYLYLDGRDSSVTLLGNTFTGRAKDNIVRVGINYHF
jgi:outer membrane immunogenic protein